jgi:hypothetical protein
MPGLVLTNVSEMVEALSLKTAKSKENEKRVKTRR